MYQVPTYLKYGYLSIIRLVIDPVIYWSSTLVSTRLSSQLLVQLSDASQSDYLDPLNYPMAIFSAN